MLTVLNIVKFMYFMWNFSKLELSYKIFNGSALCINQ